MKNNHIIFKHLKKKLFDSGEMLKSEKFCYQIFSRIPSIFLLIHLSICLVKIKLYMVSTRYERAALW